MALEDFQSESEGSNQAQAFGRGKDKMPKIQDFSDKMVNQKRESPFILDDFRGSNAYRKTNP
jgi:hypothetical protein